jgi:hypothetical protein
VHQGIFTFSSWQGPMDCRRNCGNNNGDSHNDVSLDNWLSDKCNRFCVLAM